MTTRPALLEPPQPDAYFPVAMDVIHQIFIAMFGVIGALLSMSLLIGCGSLIVRWLRLPNDPPFDVYFSAPAPAIISTPNPELAKQQAAEQVPLQALLDQARFLCLHALRCRDAYNNLTSLPEPGEEEKVALKKLKPFYKSLKDIPEQMELWFKHEGLAAHKKEIEKWHQQHQEACAAYEIIVNELPAANKTRLTFLLLALVLSVAMLLTAHLLMPS